MELPNKEQEQQKADFLKTCGKLIKKYPSKNITGKCRDCFLFYIRQNNIDDFKAVTKTNYDDCYIIASFLQDIGLIKIKSGIINISNSVHVIGCCDFSFLSLPMVNKI